MLYPYKPETEFGIEEGAFIVEMLGVVHDPACSIAQARVPPGVTTALHRVRDTVERYIITRGEGEVFVGGRAPQRVRPMDVVWIGKNEAQKIRNTSTETDLVFLCVCTPGFRPENYESLE